MADFQLVQSLACSYLWVLATFIMPSAFGKRYMCRARASDRGNISYKDADDDASITKKCFHPTEFCPCFFIGWTTCKSRNT